MKRLIIIPEMEKALDSVKFDYFNKYKKTISYTKAQKKLIEEIRKNVKKFRI